MILKLILNEMSVEISPPNKQPKDIGIITIEKSG